MLFQKYEEHCNKRVCCHVWMALLWQGKNVMFSGGWLRPCLRPLNAAFIRQPRALMFFAGADPSQTIVLERRKTAPRVFQS